MKKTAIFVATLFLASLSYGQETKPQQEGQTSSTFSHPITREALLELPRRDIAPSLSLREALKVAEKFIKRQKLDISSCYLFEVKLVEEKTGGMDPKWNFWWVRMRGGEGKDIRIIVTMEGEAELRSDL
jgi:hypothetical protein